MLELSPDNGSELFYLMVPCPNTHTPYEVARDSGNAIDVQGNHCLPVGKKKPTIYGQLKQALRYEDNNSLSPGYSYSADNEYVRYF